MNGRDRERERLLALLRDHPVAAIIGARQVGKSTLAGLIASAWEGPVERFDLEDEADLARLADPLRALRPLRGLVVLDEIQRVPQLFRALRVLADRPGAPARFLILGSASPELLHQSSETLAGRIAYRELGGFALDETGHETPERLWRRGGFPRSYLVRGERQSFEWRREFVRTFLERDLPQLGVNVSARTMRRFWSMLAHYHGQVWNASEFARSLRRGRYHGPILPRTSRFGTGGAATAALAREHLEAAGQVAPRLLEGQRPAARAAEPAPHSGTWKAIRRWGRRGRALRSSR